MPLPIVLMYHAVLDDPRERPPAREDGAELYDLPAARFAAQMEWLAAQGVPALPWQQALAMHAGRSVVITFDDGEVNNHTTALPILERTGRTATFFVTPRRVGQPGYMSREQLRALRHAGMEIGAHGLTHQMLVDLGDEELRAELAGARAELEELVGAPVLTASVPRGFYDARVLAFARDAGYERLFVSRRDPADRDPFTVGRVAVKADWTVERLALAIEGVVPARERLAGAALQGAKRLLGGRLYDRLRSVALARRG
jgi:peptidoglycan/xylan/chitin deacetylase (PgdA/CDA1 family)